MATSRTSLEPDIAEWLGPREWVLERIVTETGRVGSRAYALIRELNQLHPDFREMQLQWWRSAVVDMDFSVEGWSVRRLIKEKQCRYVSEAITWLSCLRREPEKYRALLKRPVHLIIGLDSKPKVSVH